MTAPLTSATPIATVLLRANRWRALVAAPKTVIGNPIAIRTPSTASTSCPVRTCSARQVRKPGHGGEDQHGDARGGQESEPGVEQRERAQEPVDAGHVPARIGIRHVSDEPVAVPEIEQLEV